MLPNITDTQTVIILHLLIANDTVNPLISGCIITADCFSAYFPL